MNDEVSLTGPPRGKAGKGAPERLHILVVSERLPQPDTQAGDRRLCALLEMMASRHAVDLYVGDRAPCANGEDPRRYVELLNGIGARVVEPGSIEGALSGGRYDLVFFEFWRTAARYGRQARAWQPWARRVVDSVDVHFAREAAGVKLGVMDPVEAEIAKHCELAAYRSADAVVVVTEDDRRLLDAEGGMPPLFELPITLPTRPRAGGARAQELLFVGGFGFHPNADGFAWFVRAVWPAIHAAVPEARLTAVGSNPPPEVLALGRVPGVQVLGYVPDTNPYLDRVAVSVAPLRYGGGMKGKVVEAMASGVPVVTTSAGAQGLKAVTGKHLLIADAPEEFAAAAIALLRDPGRGREVGLAGQAHAAALCGPGAVQGGLTRMLESLTAEPPPRRGPSPLRYWLLLGRYSLRIRSWVAGWLLRYPTARRLHERWLRGSRRASSDGFGAQ